jgi:hypothetical protein
MGRLSRTMSDSSEHVVVAGAGPFDLTPEPRILAVLGDIDLDQWRCLAEMVDNAIDNFVSGARAGESPEDPIVWITMPTTDDPSGRVTVRDNGSGMSAERLEFAVRAGWSGNDPFGSLGLYGMGFNIATARLGTRTRIWTTRAGDREWVGLEIDFPTLMRQRHFSTPRLSRPKADAMDHGTEVTVENIKPDQRQYFARAANRSKIARELGRTYSSMLRPGGVPLRFKLLSNGNAVPRHDHCVWNAERYTERPGLGPVAAVQLIDVHLAPRPYCKRCWLWLSAGESSCGECGQDDQVVSRDRRIHGWLGVQRFLSETDFGIDFLRYGRKIEMANKELFGWVNDIGVVEPEHPLDDLRHRGRFVGEIHIDHCRVPYSKDRFERVDPAWSEMVEVVRGQGPLRPERAREVGAPPNTSPLYRLLQVYRRTSPKPKVAGCYAKLLIVPDNDRAVEMARHFRDGEAAYQDDTKWWELVEAADRALLVGAPGGTGGGAGAAPVDHRDDDDQSGGGLIFDPAPAASAADQRDAVPTPPSLPRRVALPTLSREYRDELTNVRFDVRAFIGTADDSSLASGPWAISRAATGEWMFVVNTGHSVFRSATMTPIDALLSELAYQVIDFHRGQAGAPRFAGVLASLRDRYAKAFELEPAMLNGEARQTLTSIARSLVGRVSAEDARALFDELSTAERDAAQARMATRNVRNPDVVISNGRFLEFISGSALRWFFESHPEYFFDGGYWDEPFQDTAYQTPQAIDEARGRLVAYYSGLISDALWLADQDPSDIADAARERVMRASLALDLLEPTAPRNEEVSI